ncbi:sodium:solute symporter family transporter [Pontibacter lucknowensis]|uniref:Sodium/pantothenate symporter n=1 Tax=Pontibacter lucknowensis TaxID=1077936 RepID=A0A1N6UWD0_9BACT|nr:sodium:solute symporter [Pontibacter lucknowensis]SIQ69960.1 sodium/pantothenate symporter [Pontibacter lucknowensis]
MNSLASSELVTAGWVLVVAYAGIILFFVIRGALRIRSISDYALGNVAFSPIAVGLALAASMTSAATFIINPGFVALYGISGVISMAIALPLAALASLVVLTKGFRKMGTAVKAQTMAQWMGLVYKSRGYAMFFAFLSLLLITFIVLICVGLTKVLASMLNLNELHVCVGIVVFVFGYMMFGGANSMVYTNMIQATLMLIVAFILLGSGYQHFSDGVHGFLDKLAAIDPLLVSTTNPQSFLFRDNFEIIFCQMIIGVAIVCQPHIITKSLLLKNDKDVNLYLLTGVLVEALFFLVVFAGLYARLSFPDLMVNGQPLPVDGIMSAYVVREFPVYVGLLLVLGLISAGLSTLEGLIQSLSITITSDILTPILGDNITARGVMVNRLVIVVLAAVTIWLTFDQLQNPNLSVGIFAQNGVYAYFSAAFVPVLFGMFLKRVPLIAPVAASLTSVIVHFGVYYGGLTTYMQAPVRNPGIAAALAILASVAVGLIFYYVFRKPALEPVTEESSLLTEPTYESELKN